MINWRIPAGIVLAVAGLTASAAVAADLKVSAQWALDGPVSWDYLTLDSAGKHLFLTRSTQVDVVDTQTGKVIGTIPNTSGAHGVALAEAARRGYVSNGKSDTVTMFDLETLNILKEAPVTGHNPDAILYDRFDQLLFTFNGKSSDVSVLSPTDLKVLATFKLPGKPEFAVSDDHGQIFVNIGTEPGQMVVIDANKMQVRATWQLTGCDSPSGLAIDKTHHRLFSVCDDKVMVVTDALTGKFVTKIPIGDGPDAAAYDPRRSLIFSSNGDGSLSVIHEDTPDKYSVVQTLTTKKGARTMALDGADGTIFLASADFPAGPAPDHGRPQAIANSFAVIKVSP